jgi:hypothetical protein
VPQQCLPLKLLPGRLLRHEIVPPSTLGMWRNMPLWWTIELPWRRGRLLERVSRAEVENTMTLASAHEDAEGLVQKISLLEDELAAERWAREEFERERQAQFEELTLL